MNTRSEGASRPASKSLQTQPFAIMYDVVFEFQGHVNTPNGLGASGPNGPGVDGMGADRMVWSALAQLVHDSMDKMNGRGIAGRGPAAAADIVENKLNHFGCLFFFTSPLVSEKIFAGQRVVRIEVKFLADSFGGRRILSERFL